MDSSTGFGIAACAVGLALVLLALWLVRRSRLHATYAIWWAGTGFCLAALGLCPVLLGGGMASAWEGATAVLVAAAMAVRLLLADIRRTHLECQFRLMAQFHAQLAMRVKRLERFVQPEKVEQREHLAGLEGQEGKEKRDTGGRP